MVPVKISPITVHRHETHWALALQGDFNISQAAQLKEVLLEGLASGKELRLDLEHAGEVDIPFLQLLCAAERDAARAGTGFVSRVSETAAAIARGAGFERFPGAVVAGQAAEGGA